MNLALLDAFAAVMRTGSTTRAADVLGVSQPAVSRALMRLEDTTRLKLFERAGPRLAPTLEAEILFRELESAQIGLDRLRQVVARLREVGSGSLKIASSAALGLSFVPKVIERFLRVRPEVSVTFEIGSSSRVRDLVASGVFDVGLCADEIDVSNVIAESFVQGDGICVMPPAHPLGRRAQLSPEDLAGQRMVALTPEDNARKQLDQLFAVIGVTPKIVVETQFSATVSQLVMEGAGIGVVNSVSLFSSEEAYPRLIFRPLSPTVRFQVLMIRPPQRPRSELLEGFLATLFAHRDELVRLCHDRIGRAQKHVDHTVTTDSAC